jgi:hypothetical protein
LLVGLQTLTPALSQRERECSASVASARGETMGC